MMHVARAVAIARKGSKALLGALMMSTAISAGVVASATGTYAQSESRVSFSVPAGPLNQALTAYGRQAGLQVSYLAGLASGRTSPGISGPATREQALARLLAGTGLSWQFTNANTVTITDRVAAAHDAPVDAEGALVLDTIDVTGGGNAADAPYETAGSDSYISAENIERFRGSSPSDIFRGTPGVMSGESRNSAGVDVNIRGLQGYGRVAVTIDGAQQASVVDRGYRGDANSTMIDPDLLSSVSITKGPSNDSAASGAIAGHVAMSTITADDIVQEGETWGIRVKGGFNTNSVSPPAAGTMGGLGVTTGSSFTVATNRPDYAVVERPSSYGYTPPGERPAWWLPTGGNGSVAIATKQENFEIVAALSHRERGNYFAGTDGNHARLELRQPPTTTTGTVTQSQQNNWDTRFPGHGLVAGDTWFRTQEVYQNPGDTVYRAGEEVLNTSNAMTSGLLKGVLTLDGGHRFELGYLRNETEYGFAWPTYAISGSSTFQNPLSKAQADMLTGKYRYNPDENDLVDVSLNSWYTRQKVRESMMSDPSARNGYELRDTYIDAPMAGFDLSNRSLLQSAWGDVSLRYGLAYIVQDVDFAIDYRFIRDGVITATSNPTDNATRKQWDVFIDGRWEPTDWLTLDAGLRYMTARSAQSEIDMSSPTLLSPGERSSNGLAPSIGVTVEPFEGIQFYGSYKQGWRAPAFSELSGYYIGATARDHPGLVNGPHLKEERSTNYEIGANLLRHDVLQAGDTVGLKASYFINEIDDYISNVYGRMGTSTVSTTTNFHRARYSGVELSARYDSDVFFGEAAAIWYDKITQCPTAALCYTSGSDAGLPVNAWRHHIPPEYSLSLTAGARLFDQRLTLGGRVTHNGKSAGEPRNPVRFVNDLWWKPYTLVDAFGSYKFNDTVTLDFAVENIFDIYYEDPLAHIPQPGPGRTVRMSMTARF